MRIRWTDPAVLDFTQICDYIEQHGSAATARRVALSIYKQISGLGKFPESGRTGRHPETRELVFLDFPMLRFIVSAKRPSKFFAYYTALNSDRRRPQHQPPIPALIFLYVSSSASGNTRLSPVTVMKFVSPTQRGSTCMWTCPATPAPAARPMFIPRLTPSGE